MDGPKNVMQLRLRPAQEEKPIFCHTYDTSITIIVTKPGIIIDVVGSYFYDKKIMT